MFTSPYSMVYYRYKIFQEVVMIYVFLFIYIYISGKIILNSLDAFLATIVAIILFPFILNGMPF